MIHRYRRSMLAAVATSMVVGLAGLSGGSFLTESASAVDPPAVYDNFNGTGDANGSATEAGGTTWQALNGTWTRSGSGTVTTGAGVAANPMLVTDVGSGDVDARVVTTGASGEAVYVRVQDANNWLRARVAKAQTYFTDPEFSYTYRQWEVNYWRTEQQWQDRTSRSEYSSTTYGPWSAWSTYSTSACQTSAGDVSLPSDTDTTQYRTANGAPSGCTGGKKKWDKQSRTRTKSVDTIWFLAGAKPPPGYGPTGNTQVTLGTPYWGSPHGGLGNDPVLLGTRTVVDHTAWQDTNQVTAPNTLSGNTRTAGPVVGWWTLNLKNSTGYADPCPYQQTRTGITVLSCSLTGSTRQGDPDGGIQQSLVLDRSVAGGISTLGSWSVGSVSGFRVTAQGSSIGVYIGTGTGTQLGTVTEAAFINQTRHGCGLGGSNTYTPTNALTYCYLQALASDPGPKPVPIGLETDIPVQQAPPDSPTTDPVPSGPAVLSGVLTNGVGAVVPDMPVTIAALPDTDGAVLTLGEAVSDTTGRWTFTMPETLPAGLASRADDNGGVLNVQAFSMGTVPGTNVTMAASSAIPVGIATGVDATEASIAARAVAPPTMEFVVSRESGPDASPPSDELTSNSKASRLQETNGESPDVSGSSSGWQPTTEPDDSYNPNLVNGVDYSSAVVQNDCQRPGYSVQTIKFGVAYTTVGEGHAYWDAKATFQYGEQAGSSISAGVSADGGKHFKASGSGSVYISNKLSDVVSGFSQRGPFFARQWKVPIEYKYWREGISCGDLFIQIDHITAQRYKIPNGWAAGKFGADVSYKDGGERWGEAPYKAWVENGSYATWAGNKTAGWTLAASVWGFGPTVSTTFSQDRFQRIDAGLGTGPGGGRHDIFSYTRPFADGPGTFYSY